MSTVVKATDFVKEAAKTLGWSYEWGACENGKVDCSGLIVYLMRGLGGRVPYHGSNTMYRRDVDGAHLPMNQAKPGYLCFKCRKWSDAQKTNPQYGKEPGDIYHVGIMGNSGKIINAASKKQGVVLSESSAWDYCAKLKGVDYGEKASTKTLKSLIAAIDALLDDYRSD